MDTTSWILLECTLVVASAIIIVACLCAHTSGSNTEEKSNLLRKILALGVFLLFSETCTIYSDTFTELFIDTKYFPWYCKANVWIYYSSKIFYNLLLTSIICENKSHSKNKFFYEVLCIFDIGIVEILCISLFVTSPVLMSLIGHNSSKGIFIDFYSELIKNITEVAMVDLWSIITAVVGLCVLVSVLVPNRRKAGFGLLEDDLYLKDKVILGEPHPHEKCENINKHLSSLPLVCGLQEMTERNEKHQLYIDIDLCKDQDLVIAEKSDFVTHSYSYLLALVVPWVFVLFATVSIPVVLRLAMLLGNPTPIIASVLNFINIAIYIKSLLCANALFFMPSTMLDNEKE